jgi:dienelactone hydrolase
MNAAHVTHPHLARVGIHRPFWAAICLLPLLTALTWGADFTQGAQRDCPTGVPNQTFHCYIPKAYAERPAERFPVLFISDAGGNPGFHKLESWAEREEVVLVTINGSQNGPWEPIYAAQDAVRDAVMKQMHVSTALRFSMGNSGAGWASAMMADKQGDNWGGVLILINARRGAKIAKHVPIAWLAGGKDTTFPAKQTQADYDAAKAEGRQVRITIYPDKGHEGMPSEDEAAMLSWMLTLSRYGHPKRTPEEIVNAEQRLSGRLTELSTMSDDAAAQEACDLLLGVDAVARGKRGNELRLAWATHGLHAGMNGEPITRYRQLERVATSDRAAALPAPERKTLKDAMTELRKDKTVKADADSRAALAAVRLQETKAKTAKGALKDVAKAYAAIVDRWPATEAAATAKDEALRVLELAK